MIRYLLFVFFALIVYMGNAVASEYQLDWHVPDEELIITPAVVLIPVGLPRFAKQKWKN